jgi:calcineurin-like phosphoesterase family protein
MKVWFTSDTHFGHTNIIQYCRRPFVHADPSKCVRCKGSGVWPGRPDDEYGEPPTACLHPDIDQMNEELVARWNAVVQPDDVVWHLGDVFLGPREAAEPILRRLNGSICLVKGNHDTLTNTAWRAMGLDPRKSDKLHVDGKRIMLRHNPYKLDLTDYDFALCGHVHGAWGEREVQGKRIINVGVDVRGFRPVSLAELLGDHWSL